MAAALGFMVAVTASSDASGHCRTNAYGARFSPQALDAAAQQQKHEIEVLKGQMRDLGCAADGVVVLDGTNSGRCVEYKHLMASMKDNLASIEEQRADAAAPVSSAPCPAPAAPIRGVSQFLDPRQGDVEDLSPERQPTFLVPPPGGAHSITRIGVPSDTNAPPPYSDGGYDAMPPIEVEIGPPSIPRPMTDEERNARRVGPRFLPEPSQSLELRPSHQHDRPSR
ncbi:MAG TPA: hypothetical protein VFJ18_03520 [Pararhizobium sp.]|nr:hypothetical protein [Pararhizobium sp.]